ncbi:MAG TPA: hypothetical protein H9859_02235 [Candidatus Barnesiella excrementigallinarum]|nr:hypothetical protein [Candidatus Barnesiella excrementigallinarum]
MCPVKSNDDIRHFLESEFHIPAHEIDGKLRQLIHRVVSNGDKPVNFTRNF